MRKKTRRNPAGTLLVNPARGHRKTRARAKGKSIWSYLRKNPLLLSNPKKRGKKHHRNPILLSNPRGRVKVKGHYRKVSKHGGKRKNPILLSNPIRISRRNPAGALTKSVRRAVSGLPIVGGFLGTVVGVFGSAVGGALGVLPTSYVMPKVAKHIPGWLKPYAFTAAGLAISGIIQIIPDNWVGKMLAGPKHTLAIGVAAAGGAVDTYRYQHGKSMDLGEYEGDGEYGDAGLGDYGDIGDDGSALAAEEYADADLRDAEAMGEGDLSEEEIAAAEMGRPYYAQRFRVRAHRELTQQQKQQGCSQHAGAPGRRHGWLIYWIGFENFQKLAKLPESERRGAIEHMKNLARQTAQNVLASGSHTATMTDAETSGLLVAA